MWDLYIYRILNFKQIIFNKYATNLKTTISQRSLKNSGLLLLLFLFHDFSFLIDKMDNIIDTSVSPEQNFNQWHGHVSPSVSFIDFSPYPHFSFTFLLNPIFCVPIHEHQGRFCLKKNVEINNF